MDDLFKLSSEIQQKIVKAPIPEEMARQIKEAYARLEKQAGKGATVSLRSSALGEDSAKASFAGQYASHLNVSPQHILDTYKEVVASKYTPQAMHYRLMRGIRDSDVAMCVGCLAMVDAKSGGVVYTANPLTDGDDHIQINSTLGLPRSVVDGRTQADLFIVQRGASLTIRDQTIVQKDTAYVCYPEEGVCRLTPTGDEARAPSLTEAQVLNVAEKALAMEKHYGSYQDVEWAYDHEGNLFILQTRPLGQSEKEEQEETKEQAPVKAEPWLKGGLKISPGAASGPVFWVRKNSDAMRFPDQAVLVVEQPSPRWAALLGRAVAVLSGTGGMAGHLATVAREYRLPGLFNLKDDLEILENGQEITVDADHGLIYKGLVKQVLKNTKRRQSLIQDSPVHKTLEKALKLITPLNLLDPDSLYFKAANCQTFHDLTRFCHEKSVQEMFNFGKEEQFAEKASKQLHHNVPMQWWIINLDDGFKEEVSGKYVKLEQIACTPLLALWDGMVAIPWQGPPAVSGKGFASVMFQATTNPALATPFKTSFSNKNYFMISRHFMNLQSRFGFHFATVEVMAGPRLTENYLSFAFKGGAADLKRKQARVEFLAEILDELDFRVNIKEDTAQARVEQLSQEDMEMRLRVVGYLLMHTRQLDMVMTDPKAVKHYRNRMNSDIEKINQQFKSH
jgi:pyruvate,water dikinase